MVNHYIHRDYTVMGGEVHLDIYDDRFTVTSPGGMYNGLLIQNLDIKKENLKVTTEDLAKQFGVTSMTIKRHLAKMPYIRYVGSGYSGHWEVLDKE